MEFWINICLLVFGFVGALTAIGGDTWKPNERGNRRVTNRGWLAISCLVSTLVFGVLKERLVRENEAALQTARDSSQKLLKATQEELRATREELSRQDKDREETDRQARETEHKAQELVRLMFDDGRWPYVNQLLANRMGPYEAVISMLHRSPPDGWAPREDDIKIIMAYGKQKTEEYFTAYRTSHPPKN